MINPCNAYNINQDSGAWVLILEGFWVLKLVFEWCRIHIKTVLAQHYSLVVFYPILLWFTYAWFIQAKILHQMTRSRWPPHNLQCHWRSNAKPQPSPTSKHQIISDRPGRKYCDYCACHAKQTYSHTKPTPNDTVCGLPVAFHTPFLKQTLLWNTETYENLQDNCVNFILEQNVR